ncbi:MAG: type II toxin-antitoxin system RelE/ParE family toxin [Candidatus Brocadiales bacterium]
MPYKVEIATTEANHRFLARLPANIFPKLKKQLELLGKHPYLGRSVDAPVSCYLYSFNITHEDLTYKFVVSYKIDEGSETIFITSFGRETRLD